MSTTHLNRPLKQFSIDSSSFDVGAKPADLLCGFSESLRPPARKTMQMTPSDTMLKKCFIF